MLRHLKLTWLVVSAIVCCAAFLYLAVVSSSKTPSYPLLIPLAALAFLYAILYFNTKLIFAGKTFLQQEVRYVFSGEGVAAIAPESPGLTSWSAIPKAFELKDDFLIYYTSERMYPIPKRCLAGDEELQRFRAMLALHLGNKVRLQK